jgi:hypothetical protein
VRARLAAALTEALDLADAEAPAYEVVVLDAPNDEVLRRTSAGASSTPSAANSSNASASTSVRS